MKGFTQQTEPRFRAANVRFCKAASVQLLGGKSHQGDREFWDGTEEALKVNESKDSFFSPF